jgi:hypothetical protein
MLEKEKAIMPKRVIRVIKREERDRVTERTPKSQAKKSSQAARDMVATVTNWVSEFQQKSRAETKQALKKLFAENPHPSEV